MIANDDAQYIRDKPASPHTVATATPSNSGERSLDASENLHDPTDTSDEGQQVGTHGAGAAAFDDCTPGQVCGSPYIYNII